MNPAWSERPPLPLGSVFNLVTLLIYDGEGNFFVSAQINKHPLSVPPAAAGTELYTIIPVFTLQPSRPAPPKENQCRRSTLTALSLNSTATR